MNILCRVGLHKWRYLIVKKGWIIKKKYCLRCLREGKIEDYYK